MDNREVARELIAAAKLVADNGRVTAPPAMMKAIMEWAVKVVLGDDLWSMRRSFETDKAFMEDPKNLEDKTDRQKEAYWGLFNEKKKTVDEMEALGRKFGVTDSDVVLMRKGKAKQRFKVNLSGWNQEKAVMDGLRAKGKKKLPFPSILVELKKSSSRGGNAVAKWNRGNKTIQIFDVGIHSQSSVDMLEDTIEHEVIHMADYIMKAAGVGASDVDSGASYDPRGHVTEEEHVLSDAEFYTRLNDDIREWKRWTKRQGYTGELLKQVLEVHVGDRRQVDREFGVKDSQPGNLFRILKENDRRKYEKAKKLFLKEFGL